MRDAARTAAPVDVGQVAQPGVAPGPEDEWRSVTATGTYDAAHQLLVRNRSADAGNGYLVLVPLRTASGNDLVVMRGWVPSGPTADAPAEVPAVPAGVVTVTGRLRLPEPSSGRTDLPDGQVERIVPSDVGALTGRPTYGGWVALGTEQPTAAGTAASVATLPDGSVPQGRWPISAHGLCGAVVHLRPDRGGGLGDPAPPRRPGRAGAVGAHADPAGRLKEERRWTWD